MSLAHSNPGNQPPTGQTNSTSYSLLSAARQGIQESWETLVFLYTPLVLWWCRGRGLYGVLEPDAEDVTQRVFKAVAEKIHTFQPDGKPRPFRRWLSGIARNTIREFWRERRKVLALGRGDDGGMDWVPAPECDADEDEACQSRWRGEEQRILLGRALEYLRKHFTQRTLEMVVQVVVAGRKAGNVAAEFDSTEGAVWTATSKVLSRLRQVFGRDLEDVFGWGARPEKDSSQSASGGHDHEAH